MWQKSIGIWIRNGALMLIIAAFVIFFGLPLTQSVGRRAVAEINGEELEVATFEIMREPMRELERRAVDAGQNPTLVRDQVDRQTVDNMLRLYVLAQVAQEQGFTVSDREVSENLCAEMIEATGACDLELAREQLARNGFRTAGGSFDEARYVALARRELLGGKLSRFLGSGIRFSREATRARVERERTTLKLRYLRLPLESATSVAEPTNQELTQFIEANAEAIKTEYERRLPEFQNPGGVRARQILFQGDKALEEAAATLEKLKAGGDFAKLAKELSKDAATKELGGDLGFFQPGQMDGPLDTAIFKDQPEAVLIGPVKTNRGVHVIQIDERRPAVNRSLEQATPDLAKSLIQRDRQRIAARAQADAIVQELSSGKRLQEIAAARKLEIQETSEFSATAPAVPGLPPIQGLRTAVTKLTLESPTAKQAFEYDSGFLLVELADLKRPDAKEIDDQVDFYRARLAQITQEQILREIYEKELQRANEAGTYKYLLSQEQAGS